MKLFIAAIIIVALYYIIGFTGNPFLFIVFLPFGALSLFFVMLLQVYFLIRFLVWRILPPALRERYTHHTVQFSMIVLACCVLSLLGILVLHYYWSIRVPYPVILLGDMGVLGCAAFFGRCLLVPKKKMLGAVSLAAFILLDSSITVFISTRTMRVEPSSLDVLKSLSYLTWVPSENNLQKSGVVLYDKNSSYQGLNLYNSRDLATAYLMDMSGTIVHTWTSRIGEGDGWHHVELLKNGDLLANVKEEGWVKLGWDSDVKWVAYGRYHHDIAVAENQDLYTFARKDDVVFNCGLPLPILNEHIVILSPEGTIKREIPLYAIVKKNFHPVISARKMLSIYRRILNVTFLRKILAQRPKDRFILGEDTVFDIFHANSIEIVDTNIDGICKKGDLLISLRNLNCIAMLDIDKERIVWSWGRRVLLKQHNPTLLADGHVLVFDNGDEGTRRYSRIVEVDPVTRHIVWEYKADVPEDFFSPSRGGNQRLPNGNTLITNSDNGEVFEVTPNGRKVWNFYNPRIREKSKERAAIYRMMRVTDLENYPRLKALP